MLALLGYLALGLFAIGGRAGYVLLQEFLDTRRIERGRELGHAARKLDLEERAIAVTEQRAKAPAVPSSIPADLMRRVTRWTEKDAQDSERKILLDLYNDFADAPDAWAEVRAHLPAEPDDRMPTELFTGLVQ